MGNASFFGLLSRKPLTPSTCLGRELSCRGKFDLVTSIRLNSPKSVLLGSLIFFWDECRFGHGSFSVTEQPNDEPDANASDYAMFAFLNSRGMTGMALLWV
jgi:hypothetical protein